MSTSERSTVPPAPPGPFLGPILGPNLVVEPPRPPPLHVPSVDVASGPPRRLVAAPDAVGGNAKLLPQQETPTPKTKMKTINWNKIPHHKVIGKRNIWSLVADEHQNSPMADLDWSEMEGLFCQQVPIFSSIASSSGSGGPSSDTEKRRREHTEIVLLDGKRSLNVNIFLKQFRSSNDDVIRLIREGDHGDIGLEKLRGLLKILPEVEEVEKLKNFEGDKSKLGNAEKFFLQLMQVPNYKLRVECMLLKEEFEANISYLEPSINSMILAGEDLMTNKALQEVLYMVLVAGNFLNSGGYAGNAAGVKLSSLQKLTEIRANKPGMNLIHYVALQAERKRKDLLDFARNMSTLEAATKTTVEQLSNEFNSLDTKIKKIKSQIQLPTTDNDIRTQMSQFLQIAEQEMKELRKDMAELECVRQSLAEFFCEDTNTFKIEECFRVFHHFCQKFNEAVAENERRRIQEEQVITRRKQREEQLKARKRFLSSQNEIPVSESESNLIEYGLFDVHTSQRSYGRNDAKMKRLQNGGVTSDEDISITGSPSIRRRLGSANLDQQSTKEDTYSPDITPNGTLRRRRSRVPCEDDDGNLLDFLRISGQENARERKSWGSLDRSWARRARGQPKRSDLLNADFSGDRERPSSPSPLLESKPFLQEDELQPAGKAWRQKIEAWLTENEKEERAGEEHRKRAKELQANRRSFEDSVDDTATPEGYSNVYDWRSMGEKCDANRSSEAMEEPQVPHKDKSFWRKSNLNIPSNAEDMRKLRSRHSTENIVGSSNLQAIREEERKRHRVDEATETNPTSSDELTIYIREPYLTTQNTTARRGSKFSKKSLAEERVSDKIDIDSDNVETPPATRKVFSPPREVKPVEKEPCKRERCNSSFHGRDTKGLTTKPGNYLADLGNGNFDRYAAARKTRRYKRSPDLLGDKESRQDRCDAGLSEEKLQRPNTLAFAEEGKVDDTISCIRPEDPKPGDPNHDIDAALAEIAKSGEDLQRLSRSTSHRSSRLPVSQPAPVVAVTNTVLSPVMQESRPREPPVTILPERAVPSRERHMSMIDPSQVKRAMRLTSNPPSRISQDTVPCVSAPGNTGAISPPGTTCVTTTCTPRNQSPEDRSDLDRTDCPTRVEPSYEPQDADLHSNRESEQLQGKTELDTTLGPAFQSRFIPDIAVTNAPISSLSLFAKHKDQELNDEGFEETQSLVSEAFSQETSSGNFEADTQISSRCSPAEMGNISVIQVPGISCSSPSPLPSPLPPAERIDKSNATTPRKPPQKIRSFERKVVGPGPGNGSFLPKRTGSMKHDIARTPDMSRKNPTALPTRVNPPKNEVERSSSRSSLRSSRSSLNSATSVNTVRNLGPNHSRLGGYTSAIRALTNDLRKSHFGAGIAGMPGIPGIPGIAADSQLSAMKESEKRKIASRNSASRIPSGRSAHRYGSTAVGLPGKNIPRSTNVQCDVPKRNPGVSASRSSSSGSSIGHQSSGTRRIARNIAPSSKSRPVQSHATPRNLSFMRPTAASSNKGSISNLPRNVKNLVK
ncbi:uncharacterized protein LOC105703237 isoform X2 [Orussus abietinus]|uniref:uncharacterized protein LOC105703237 isoform X2 n=1 Tax=Orussus abietinus TaxID=222816 RepID=UPI0006254D39|nr:uncharacterized protein LOC105703237 isoform X2 [Orussus abietinus]